jgi:thioredoxin-like negative regulator of GroEL
MILTIIYNLMFIVTSAFGQIAIPSDSQPSSSAPSVVVDLTKENFKQFIDQHPVVLVEFYAPW